MGVFYYAKKKRRRGMMKWDKYVSIISASLGAIVNHLWGGLDVMFGVLLLAMALDFVAGILCGVKDKKLDSQRAYLGITRKKMMILIMVAVGVAVDKILNLEGTTRSLVIFYYFAMEGI